MTGPERPDAAGPEGSAGDRAIKLLTQVVIAAFLLLAVWLVADVLLIVFAAVLVAIAYRAIARCVSRRAGVPIGAALALVAAAVVGLVAAGAWWGGSAVAEQVDELWTQLQYAWGSVQAHLHGSAWGRRILEDLSNERIAGRIDSLVGQFAGAALTTFGAIGSMLIVVVTAIYLAAQPELYRRGFLALLPTGCRPRGAEVLAEIGETLRWWLLGRAIDMSVVMAVTFAGLMLLGIPLALVLAIIAGLLNFIPYIGAFAGAVPALLVAFGQGPTQALWVALLFLGIQMIEGYLLAPQIQQRTASLPPALTILSQTMFGTLFGLLGLLLAPALAVTALVAVRALYVRDVLGEADPEAIRMPGCAASGPARSDRGGGGFGA